MNTEHTPEPLFQYVYTTYILGGHCYFSNYHYCNLSFDESYVSFILLITFIRSIISIALLLLSSLSSLLLLIATVAIATVIAIVIAIVFASQFSPRQHSEMAGPPGHVRRCRRVDVDGPQVLITWRHRAIEKVVMKRGKGLEEGKLMTF